MGDPRRVPDRPDATMHHVLFGLGLRLRWQRLVENHDRRFPLGLLALANGLVSLGLLASLAFLTQEPFVFPSLGPTAFLLFYRPHAPAASPRQAILGHVIGVLAAVAALNIFRPGPLTDGLDHGVNTARIGAAALSLGLTAAFMVWLDAEHPPAGATTLIVSLGLLDSPLALSILMVGVLLLVGQGLVVNRLAGLDYPLWSPRTVPQRRVDTLPGSEPPGPSERSVPVAVTEGSDADRTGAAGQPSVDDSTSSRSGGLPG